MNDKDIKGIMDTAIKYANNNNLILKIFNIEYRFVEPPSRVQTFETHDPEAYVKPRVQIEFEKKKKDRKVQNNDYYSAYLF